MGYKYQQRHIMAYSSKRIQTRDIHINLPLPPPPPPPHTLRGPLLCAHIPGGRCQPDSIKWQELEPSFQFNYLESLLSIT